MVGKTSRSFLLFLVLAALSACSGDGETNRMSLSNLGEWSPKQLDRQSKACIEGALAGQSIQLADFESQAEKFCLCVFSIVSKQCNYSQYQSYSETILQYLTQDGSLRDCYGHMFGH